MGIVDLVFKSSLENALRKLDAMPTGKIIKIELPQDVGAFLVGQGSLRTHGGLYLITFVKNPSMAIIEKTGSFDATSDPH